MKDKFLSKLRESGSVLGRWIEILCVLVFFAGVYFLFSNSISMLRHDFEDAANSPVTERSVTWYDVGLQRYEAQDYDNAVKALQLAYNDCLGKNGVVNDDKRKLASNIKFLTGNALVRGKQLQQAVEAYKDALRLDPDNLYAKYNLEMLQSMNGGQGPGSGPGGEQKPGDGQPGKGIKKGI
jgi:tetratricopeptide (TPR) repeat protein